MCCASLDSESEVSLSTFHNRIRNMLSEWKAFPLWGVLIVLTFMISGTFLSLGLFIVSLVLWPISRHLYRQVSYYFIYPAWAQVLFLIDWWAPSEIHIHASPEDEKHFGKEHALVVMNHSYDVDWLAGWLVCDRYQLLAASKVYAKKSLMMVPVIGWLWKLGEIIFLDRDWQKDRSRISEQINQISQYANPVWILLFPEGTRFTPKKHAISLEFAKKEGLPQLRHLLTPRTKGFVATIQSINECEDRIPALYQTTVAFETGPGKNEPTLMNLIRGRSVSAHFHVKRIPISDVPVEEKACAAWLHKEFAVKDGLLEEFKSTGSFPDCGHDLKQRPYSLINEVFWVSLVVFGMLYYVPSWWVLSAVLVGTSIALHFLARVTVSSKGSSYGNKGTEKAKDK